MTSKSREWLLGLGLRPRGSLALKIGGALAAIVVVSLSVHILVNDARQRLLEQKKDQAKQFAGLVVGSVRQGMLSGDPGSIQDYLDAIQVDQDVHDIRIFDSDGVLRFALDHDRVGRSYDRSIHPDCVSCHASPDMIQHSLVREVDQSRIFSVDIPLLNEDRCHRCHGSEDQVLGNLLVDINLTGPDLATLAGDKRLASTGLVLVGLTMLSAWLLLKSMVVRPLRLLVSAAHEVEAGNFNPVFPETKDDEMGELVAAFKRMTARLGHLVRYQEQEIAARTQELRRSQHKIIHQEKMAALGRLSAGLAHEVGNPLASISAQVQMLLRHSKDEASRNTARDLLAQVDRINRIVREMLEHSHPGQRRAEWVDVSRVVHTALRIARYDRGLKDLPIETVIAPACPRVYVVEDELLQVVLNVLLNAADATSSDGMVRIEAKPWRENGVEVVVADNGSGIAAEDLERVFDPFFTSKPPGKGTGLGLWVSYSVVKSWGGQIEVESKVDSGTQVRIFLPRGKETGEHECADPGHRRRAVSGDQPEVGA